MYRMSDDTCGYVPGSLARCQTYIGRTYGIRYRIDDEKRYCCELLNKALRNATGEQLLGDLTGMTCRAEVTAVPGRSPPP
jgi:hypothetical protein